MKILIVHLSDLHAGSDDDPVLSRSDAICDAVQNLEYEPNAVIIIVSGDVANTGQEMEYLAAGDFLEKIQRTLTARLCSRSSTAPAVVAVVAVAGNHDCDFSRDQTGRTFVLDGVLRQPERGNDPSVVSLCLDVQESFFEFLRSYAPPTGTREKSGSDSRMYYEHQLRVDNEAVTLLCCNTAWLSRLHEKQGQLMFPESAIPLNKLEDALTIAVFHHPYNWMEPTSGRKFSGRIERIADVVFTGHEHTATKSQYMGGPREGNTYIEGGALQVTDCPSASAFNACVFDTQKRQYKFASFVWDDICYIPTEKSIMGDEGAGLGWAPYPLSSARARCRFALNEGWRETLNDPGVFLTHRDRGTLTLPDIFIFPDLRERSFEPGKIPKVRTGDNVPKLVAENKHLMITGESNAGKTCLGKMLFLHLLEKGEVPILIDGGDHIPSGDRLYGYLESVFTEQYNRDSLDLYQQLDVNQRTIIVDNFHKQRFKSDDRLSFLARLAAFAGRVIILAENLPLALNEASLPDLTDRIKIPFIAYQILPFGHERRNALLEKWLLLAADADESCVEFAHQLDKLNRDLDTLIGRNYVPSYPGYILAVLQATEAATPVDTRASTHGYFYELLIRAALAQGRTRTEFDVITGYLAHLAYWLFTSRVRECGAAEFQKIHAEYEHRYDVTIPSDRIIQDLLVSNILAARGSGYGFKYPYIYYYFVASYVRDHLDDSVVLSQVQDMSRKLYVEEYANILLFLAHLSKNPVIIDSMLDAAKSTYAEVSPASLLGDVKFLDESLALVSKVVYEEKDPRSTRIEMLRKKDQEEGCHQEAESANDDTDVPDTTRVAADPAARVNAALKTQRILGQILKNFPGTLEGPRKLEIAKACADLGMRVLSAALRSLADNQEQVIRRTLEILRKHEPKLDYRVIEGVVRGFNLGVAWILSFGLIKITSGALGSRQLGPTYERMLGADTTPSTQLVHLSLALDHFGDFPLNLVRKLSEEFRKTSFADSLLQLIVVHHFSLFPVAFRIKQKACAIIDVPYVSVRTLAPAAKLLKG
jgi:predicted phosphodiesterase/ABC-type oligopeptide transport system ATPase subunit